MGTYVNPGKNNFQMSVNSEIFVDKTEMIAFLNREKKIALFEKPSPVKVDCPVNWKAIKQKPKK